MIAALTPTRRFQTAIRSSLCRIRPSLSLFTLLILFPALALAQSPFDTGFTAMQTLFTGTVAKVASLIAIVVGADGKTIKTMEHRAGWDATFSAPKSISLTALVGGDDN